MDPRTFRPEFNLIQELTDAADKYKGENLLTLYNFPTNARISLDRIRARVPTVTRPSLSSIIACCTAYGLSILSANEDIRTLLRLKDRLDWSDAIDAGDLEELHSWFRSFHAAIPNGIGSGEKRQNVYLPDYIKDGALSFSADLGSSSSAVITLATMVTLSQQPAVVKEHREAMEAAMQVYYRRVSRRCRVAEMLLEEAGVEERS